MNKTNLQENPMNLVCLFICWCSSPISTSENCVKSCVSIDPTQLSHQIDHRRPVVWSLNPSLCRMDLLRIFIRPRPTRLTCLIAGEVQAGVPRACMVLPLVGRGRGRGQPLQVGLRAAGDHPARQVRPRARSRAANEPLAKFSQSRRRPLLGSSPG